MARLRLAIVGCGDIAGYMAWFARLNPRIELAACCDVSAERVRAFAGRFHIPQTFTAYDQMLATARLDAVYLATPHHLHAAMLTEAIQAGLPAFVEKPVTRTLAEARQIASLAQERDVRVGVNYQYRYDSGCYALARGVQRGDLGQIACVRVNVPWRRTAGYFEQARWHSTWAQAGGGTLITQGSHLLDVALWALGGRPKTAMGYTARRKFRDIEVEDLAQGTIEMEDGALVQVCSSMAASPEQALTIEVYGERGTGIYTDRPWPRVTFRGARVDREWPPHRGIHALQRSLEGFRAWVMEGKPHLTPAAEALPALAAVEAIYRSAQSGRREDVAVWRPGD